MGVDSDATSKALDAMSKEPRAAAQKSNPRWQSPPESAAVKAQRDANDRHGREIDPWKRGK